MAEIDWYERRHELKPGQVFRLHDGDVVRLDRRKAGDGTRWLVDDWSNGWSCWDSTAEPGDLKERLPDDWSGDPAEGAANG